MRITKLALAAGALSFAASAASAVTFNFSGAGSATGTPVSATISVTFDTLVGSDYQFDVSVTNTSSAVGSNQLVGFAFITDPATDLVSETSSIFFGTNGGGISGLGQTFDFCFDTDLGGNNCNSGSGTGLAEGATDTFKMIVSAAAQPLFVGGAARWQRVGLNDEDSAKSVCAPGSFECGPSVEVVPVPASLPLLAGGLALAGLVMRRRRNAA